MPTKAFEWNPQDVAASGDWLPYTDGVSNLGSLGSRFRSLYLSLDAIIAGAITAASLATVGAISGGAISGSSVTATGDIVAGAGNLHGWTGRSAIKSSADGIIDLFNNAANGFTRLNFGGTTNAFPAWARNTTTLRAKLADDSNYAGVWTADVILGVATSGFWIGNNNTQNKVLDRPSAGISVGGTATTICTGFNNGGTMGSGELLIVVGNTGGGATTFADLVFWAPFGAAPTATVSRVQGTPAARTYTILSNNQLQLAMASGAYTVSVTRLASGWPA